MRGTEYGNGLSIARQKKCQFENRKNSTYQMQVREYDTPGFI